mgnify:CR=1 FL=1
MTVKREPNTVESRKYVPFQGMGISLESVYRQAKELPVQEREGHKRDVRERPRAR